MTHAHEHSTPAPAVDPGRSALTDALQVSFRLLIVTMVLIAIAYLLSGIFIVQEHERAYVLVFGRVTGVGTDRVKGPGLHWTWPKPVSEIVRVPAERIQQMEVDTLWFEEAPSLERDTRRRGVSNVLRPLRDGYLLTGDANIIHTRWGVRYTVRDPERFLFRVADAERVLHWELNRSATRTAQRWSVDRALRADLEGFRGAVDAELRSRLRTHPLGLELHRLDLLAITPPLQVEAAFDAVVQAEQDRSRSISAARAYAARVGNETRGEEARTHAEALAERQRVVSEAGADADFFLSVLEAHRAYPAVLAPTLWQDRIRAILPRTAAHYLVYERTDGKQELRLQLGPPTPQP